MVGLATIGLSGCGILRDFQPSVAVNQVAPKEYIAQQRGHILTTGALSAQTMQTIRVAGLDMRVCATPSAPACIAALSGSLGISEERKLSALSELWLQQAMLMPGLMTTRNAAEVRFTPWMEAARHAYGYLFFTARSPGDRAFEERQTQVRHWYNYAVQQAVTLLFQASSGRADNPHSSQGHHTLHLGHWVLHVDMKVRMPQHSRLPQALLPASSLVFHGLRGIYRRDGFGSELVAVTEKPLFPARSAPDDAASMLTQGPHRQRPSSWSEMPSPNITVVFRFGGESLDEVLRTEEVHVSVHDPLVENQLTIRDQQVPLSGNFTAGYGVWLVRSGLNRQSKRSLFGREQRVDRPRLYMLQPFDPDRRIILMRHGPSIRPEVWVNVANEILGNEDLRREYQVWQIYYPTNMSMASNHASTGRLLQETLGNFDPEGETAASKGLVVVGSGRVLEERTPDPERSEGLLSRLDAVGHPESFPGMEGALFIAVPQRGISEADDDLVPYRSSYLPGAVSEKAGVCGHRVRETAAAIREIRRILHEELAAREGSGIGSGEVEAEPDRSRQVFEKREKD